MNPCTCSMTADFDQRVHARHKHPLTGAERGGSDSMASRSTIVTAVESLPPTQTNNPGDVPGLPVESWKVDHDAPLRRPSITSSFSLRSLLTTVTAF